MTTQEDYARRRRRAFAILMGLLIVNLIVCQGQMNVLQEIDKKVLKMQEIQKAQRQKDSCVCITQANPLVIMSCEDMKRSK